MIVRDLVPFSFVKRKGFIELIIKIMNNQKLPSTYKLSHKILNEKYFKTYTAINKRITNARKVSLSVDLWTTPYTNRSTLG
jgi:hypothetical protein